jgi:uncharacterized membrane protein
MMTTAARRRIFQVILLVSLAVNLGLIGFLGGQWLTHGGHGGPPGISFNPHAAFKTLPTEDEALVREIWQRHRPEFSRNFRQMRQARREVKDLLMTEPLDRQAIDLRQAQISGYRQEIDAIVGRTLLETAETLPPHRRRAFFEAGFARSRHHGGPRKPPGDSAAPGESGQ